MKPRKYSYQYRDYTLKMELDADGWNRFHVKGYEDHGGMTKDTVEGTKKYFEEEIDNFLDGDGTKPCVILGQKLNAEEVKFRSRYPMHETPKGEIIVDLPAFDYPDYKPGERFFEAFKRTGIAIFKSTAEPFDKSDGKPEDYSKMWAVGIDPVDKEQDPPVPEKPKATLMFAKGDTVRFIEDGEDGPQYKLDEVVIMNPVTIMCSLEGLEGLYNEDHLELVHHEPSDALPSLLERLSAPVLKVGDPVRIKKNGDTGVVSELGSKDAYRGQLYWVKGLLYYGTELERVEKDG